MSKLVFCKNYVLSILRVAPDGNCLFSSLAHQIFGGRRDINGVLPSIFLRHKIIDYLWANLGQYTPSEHYPAISVPATITRRVKNNFVHFDRHNFDH